MKKLYCFDFDGTLTYKDTMFIFLKFYNPSKYYFQFLKHIPLFILLKLGLSDAEKVKKSFISGVLKGEARKNLQNKSHQFFEHYFPNIIRDNALDFINNIDKDNTECYLVTASLDIWVEPFAKHFNMKLLSTEALFQNEVFSGEFSTKNCNGEEKVRRIKSSIGNKKFDKMIAFGDTFGDKPMLEFANEGYFRFFH